MSNSVEIEEIGKTQDSQDSVFRAEVGESWMDFIFPTGQDEDVWVHMVKSAERGGMKTMLDHICRKYECESIRFCTPLSKTLTERLDGFEYESKRINEPGSEFHGEKFESLVGKWDVNGRE